MILSVNFKGLTLLLAGIAIYLLWMDVGFYLEVQQLQPRQLTNSSSSNFQDFNFSPFHPITVKLMMLSPTIQFIDEPLAYLTVYHSRIAEYISPDAASIIGVLLAALAARFFIKEELKYRQLGVLLFKIRDYFDGLDGCIFRERNSSHSVGHVINPKSFGWMMDGVCDGLGDAFRFLAFIIVLQRYFDSNGGKTAGYQYQLVVDIESSICQKQKGESAKLNWCSYIGQLWAIYKKAFLIILCIGLQSLIGSICWNYFMFHYHVVLETDFVPGMTNPEAVVSAQNNILRSSAMWMVCYFWRLVNPQTVTQYQLLAILYNKELDLILGVQLLGFLPPLLVSAGSFLHLSYATSIIQNVAI